MKPVGFCGAFELSGCDNSNKDEEKLKGILLDRLCSQTGKFLTPITLQPNWYTEFFYISRKVVKNPTLTETGYAQEKPIQPPCKNVTPVSLVYISSRGWIASSTSLCSDSNFPYSMIDLS